MDINRALFVINCFNEKPTALAGHATGVVVIALIVVVRVAVGQVDVPGVGRIIVVLGTGPVVVGREWNIVRQFVASARPIPAIAEYGTQNRL